jgi:hypothetical protein
MTVKQKNIVLYCTIYICQVQVFTCCKIKFNESCILLMSLTHSFGNIIISRRILLIKKLFIVLYAHPALRFYLCGGRFEAQKHGVGCHTGRWEMRHYLSKFLCSVEL